MPTKSKKIHIAMLNQGKIRTELALIVEELSRTDKYILSRSYPTKKPISQNRNKAVKDFLETDADFLLMMDEDCPPKYVNEENNLQKAVNRMLELADYDKDIIGGTCFGFLNNMVIPFAMKKNKQGTYDMGDVVVNTGVQEVDAIGTGNILIARRVLEKIPFPFRNEYDSEGIKTKGLDFNFCERAKEKGYKVWADTSLLHSHHTTFDLCEVWLTINQYRTALRNKEEQIKKLTKRLDELQKIKI